MPQHGTAVGIAFTTQQPQPATTAESARTNNCQLLQRRQAYSVCGLYTDPFLYNTDDNIPRSSGMATSNGTTNHTYNLLNTTNTDDSTGSRIAIITTIVFALLVAVTNGGLLLIFLRHKNTRRHLSIVQTINMLNVLIGAFFDLTLRLPLFILTEDKVSSLSLDLCHTMRIIPDYFMLAILLCLPLISGERLLKLTLNPPSAARRSKHIVGALLVVAYSLALIISFMPMSDIFGSGTSINTRCAGSLKYGYTSFAFTYTAITALSVLLTAVFSVAIVLVLKVKLKLQKSKSKKIVMRRGVSSAIWLTVLLAIATVPFAISLQLVLTCGAEYITNDKVCDTIIPYIFRVSVIVQKIGFTILPIIFLKLNPTMRRKIWLTIRRPRQAANIVTISSSNTEASRSTDKHSDSDTNDDTYDSDFVIVSEEYKCPPEVVRRATAHSIMRQSFLDMVDVLSVISEVSENSQHSHMDRDSIHRTDSRASSVQRS